MTQWPTFEQIVGVVAGFTILFGMYKLLYKALEDRPYGKKKIEALEKQQEIFAQELKTVRVQMDDRDDVIEYLEKRWERIEDKLFKNISL